MHKSVIFLVLQEGRIVPLPQERYVRLVRGEAAMLEYAGKTLRLADLYISLEPNPHVERETYSVLSLDDDGRVIWPTAAVGPNAVAHNHAPPQQSWAPTSSERVRLIDFALMP